VPEPQQPRPHRIVSFYNGDHAPYQVKVWPAHVPHLKWLLEYIAKQAIEGSVWEFTHTKEDGQFSIILTKHCTSHAFCHQLHEAAKEAGFETITVGQLGDLEQLLKENGHN